MTLALIGTLTLLALFTFVPEIPQPLTYHAFADKKSLFGIPNWNNIWSSLLYIPLGIWGLGVAHTHKLPKERLLWQIFFAGVILIGIGSTAYHLQPNNESLVIDRIPIAIVLMTFLSILVEEEKGAAWGLYLLPFALCLGIFSVIWWIYSERMGAGDLRLYIWVQFIASFAALLFAYFRSGRRRWLLITVASLFAASKVFEFYDVQIYARSYDLIGGHPIKHILSAAAVVCLILYSRARDRS